MEKFLVIKPNWPEMDQKWINKPVENYYKMLTNNQLGSQINWPKFLAKKKSQPHQPT